MSSFVVPTPTGGFWKSHREMDTLASDIVDAMGLYAVGGPLPAGFPCPLFGMPVFGLVPGTRELGVHSKTLDLIAVGTKLLNLSMQLKLLGLQRDSLLTLKGMAR
jgi:hypothetical protein